MAKINIAVVGYGNTGKFAVEAVQAAEDMNLSGVIVRPGSKNRPSENSGITVVENIAQLNNVDVAVLCTPTREVETTALNIIKLGVNTVDSYDIHTSIVDLRKSLGKAAKDSGRVAIISAGWDPGSDSVVRTLIEACAPKGITYTNFGSGMSMGHSVAVKAVEGVEDALSMTIPLGTGIHRRIVYVKLKDDAKLETVADKIRCDPYFMHDETHVIQVDNVDKLTDRGHGVNMVRKGVSGYTDNQLFEFNMKINNPALTTQVMIACARASMKQSPGAYTMIEIPVIDYIPGEPEDVIRKLV